MTIPIEDAVTVSYVGIVHAISELEEADDHTESGRIIECVYDALEDLRNAIRVLRPHVRVADDDTRRVRDSLNEYYNPSMTEHRHMYVGCWCGQ
jgi:hypothetical protein